MSRCQEAYNIIFDELIAMPELNEIDKKRLLDSMDLLQELVDKHEKLEQENFDLRQKLNTEEECCVMLEKKVNERADLIKSLCKALEDNNIDLSYLMFSYLTPQEWQYCKELLDYE